MGCYLTTRIGLGDADYVLVHATWAPLRTRLLLVKPQNLDGMTHTSGKGMDGKEEERQQFFHSFSLRSFCLCHPLTEPAKTNPQSGTT